MRKFCTIHTLDAAVASASSLIDGLLNDLDRLLLISVLSKSTRHFRKCTFRGLLQGLLGAQALSSAADNLTILDKALDQPVVVAWAVDSAVDASLAEVVVALVTHVAMIVRIGHWLIALVAEDRP